MATNVLGPNRQAERLLALVHEYRPDVLVTLETDSWWEAHLDQLSDDYPHSIRCPQDNLYGMHVYSRLPLEEPELKFLVENDVPSMHARVRVDDSLSVRMHFLHPAPPSPTENDESTERDVELLVVARSIQHSDDPIIVTGDLNDVAWSPTTRLFRKISGLLDHAWAAACTTPSMPITGSCAGRWTTSFTVRTSVSSACCACRTSAPIISRCSSSCSTTRSTLKSSKGSRLIVMTSGRPPRP